MNVSQFQFALYFAFVHSFSFLLNFVLFHSQINMRTWNDGPLERNIAFAVDARANFFQKNNNSAGSKFQPKKKFTQQQIKRILNEKDIIIFNIIIVCFELQPLFPYQFSWYVVNYQCFCCLLLLFVLWHTPNVIAIFISENFFFLFIISMHQSFNN